MKKKLQTFFVTFIFILVITGNFGFCRAEAKVANDISSVRVLDSDVVRVKFSGAKKLTANDIKISTKKTKKSAYKKTLAIERVEKVNSKVYDVILKTNDSKGKYIHGVYIGYFVRVKIGVSSKETIYYEANKPKITYFTGVINKRHSESISFEQYTKGTCKFSISKLPNGIKAKKYDNYVVLSGKPKYVLNGKKVIITATDAYGKKVNRTVLFYVGSSSKVVVYAEEEMENNTVLSGDGRVENINIIAIGGTGGYKYKMTNKVSGVSLANGNNYFKVSDSIASGNHNIKYTVTDKKGHKASSLVKFMAKKAVKLSIILKTKDKKSVNKRGIELEYRDRNNKYYSSYSDMVYDINKPDTYTAYVAPDMTYRVNISLYNDKLSLFYRCCSVAKKAKKMNVNLPVYKVTLKASDNSSLENVSWCIGDSYDDREYGEILGKGAELYLTEGEYKITGKDDSSDISYDSPQSWYTDRQYTAEFSVKSSKTAMVNVTEPKNPDVLEENVYQDVKISLRGTIYKFTPSKTGPYAFRINDVGEDRSFSVALYSRDSLEGCLFSDDRVMFGRYFYQVNLIAGHTFYLVVQTKENYEDGRMASVKFEPIPVIETESSISVSVKHSEMGYYAFIPPVTGQYTLNATDISGYALIAFIDPYGGRISHTTGPKKTEETLSSNEELVAGQMYYVRVFAADSDVNMKLNINYEKNQQHK